MPGNATRLQTSACRRPLITQTFMALRRDSRRSALRVAVDSSTFRGRASKGASVPSKSRNSAIALASRSRGRTVSNSQADCA